jgi:hypothetical protein
MDPIDGGAASWQFLGGELRGPWIVAVHAEEETVAQLMKRVRMLPSMAAPVGVVVLVGGDGRGVSRSIDSRGSLGSEGGHH